MTRLFSPCAIRWRIFLSFVLCLLTCDTAVAAPVRLIDDSGASVELEAPARRVAALYGAFNDILLGMGMGECLVARTVADGQPELAALPVIGTHMRPNLELIAALHPDLILQFEGRREARAQVDQLRALGFRVAVFRGGSFSDLYRIIKALGVLTGAEGRAGALTESLRARLNAVAQSRAGAKRPRVFFEIRSPNLLAAGVNSTASAIIEAAGADNVVRAPDRVARLSEEELIRLDPDVYIVQQGPMNRMPVPPDRRDHYRHLRAVREGHVLTVDESLFSRPAPGMVDAVEMLAGFFNAL